MKKYDNIKLGEGIKAVSIHELGERATYIACFTYYEKNPSYFNDYKKVNGYITYYFDVDLLEIGYRTTINDYGVMHNKPRKWSKENLLKTTLSNNKKLKENILMGVYDNFK